MNARWIILTMLLFSLTLGISTVLKASPNSAMKFITLAEGKSYAKESTLAISKEWSATELIKRAQSNKEIPQHKDEIEQSCKLFFQSLGPARSIESIELLRENAQENGFLQQSYLLRLICQNAPATVAIVIHKDNTKWELDRFVVRTQELKPYINPDPEEFAAYAEKIVPAISKTWDSDNLVSFADGSYAAELVHNPMIQRAVLRSVCGLGQFKKLKQIELGQKAFMDNKLVYIVQGEAEFDNGEASIWLHLVEESEGWKLHRFNIQGQKIASTSRQISATAQLSSAGPF